MRFPFRKQRIVHKPTLYFPTCGASRHQSQYDSGRGEYTSHVRSILDDPEWLHRTVEPWQSQYTPLVATYETNVNDGALPRVSIFIIDRVTMPYQGPNISISVIMGQLAANVYYPEIVNQLADLLTEPGYHLVGLEPVKDINIRAVFTNDASR